MIKSPLVLYCLPTAMALSRSCVRGGVSFLVAVVVGASLASCEGFKGSLEVELAKGKTVYQKSVAATEGYDASKITDGRKETDLEKGGCFHSDPKADIYPIIDLADDTATVFAVKRLLITLPKGFTLKNLQIQVSQVSPHGSSANTTEAFKTSNTCFLQTQKFANEFSVTCKRNMIGRYVIVTRENDPLEEPLAICEVEVFGVPLMELARHKPTAQSSLGSDGFSKYAVDGHYNSSFWDTGCTHTLHTPHPWWEVDLGEDNSPRTVYQIFIMNRSDCCSSRLKNFKVWLADVPKSVPRWQAVQCAHFHGQFPASAVIPFGTPRRGRYLSIQLMTANPLTLCEVEVWGTDNPCAINRCGGGDCVSDDGYNYSCECYPGFIAHSGKCINPCANHKCGDSGTCAPAGENHVCKCAEGYMNVDEKDGYGGGCAKDPCYKKCQHHGTCQRNGSEFHCNCDAGFEMKGEECKDIDECAQDNRCGEHATCTNNTGSYACTCNKYYTGDGLQCSAIDNCARANGGCGDHATCTDGLAKEPKCECHSDYKMTTKDGEKQCVPIDHCAVGSHSCVHADLCKRGVGGVGYICGCPKGYTGDGLQGGTGCKDVNECATGGDTCSDNATCLNTVGSYECKCNSFYTGNGIHCTPVDSCKTENGGCDENAVCKQTPGNAPVCTCQAPKFTGDGKKCTKVAPCQLLACDYNATCKALDEDTGECTCNKYFTGSGISCTAKDMCADNNGGCHAKAMCSDGEGKEPTCQCQHLYEGDGKKCEIADLCSPKYTSCDPNATCSQQGATVSCSCKHEFAGDGTSCVAFSDKNYAMKEDSVIKVSFEKPPKYFTIFLEGCASLVLDLDNHRGKLSSDSVGGAPQEMALTSNVARARSVILFNFRHKQLDVHIYFKDSSNNAFDITSIPLDTCVVKKLFVDIKDPKEKFESIRFERTTNFGVHDNSGEDKDEN